MDNQQHIDELIRIAIREDIGDGDHTTLSCIPLTQKGKAQLIIKDEGVLCGVEIAQRVFEIFDPSVTMKTFIPDGTRVKKGDIAFVVEGPSVSLLQCERLVLNFMQRLSGISTQTSVYVNLLAGTNAKILDTRKTTPGMRILEKYAVKMGGGENHRIGLYDMILIKDNHIDFCGGVTNALHKATTYLRMKQKKLQIVIEARTMQDIQEILDFGGVFRILIDNFSPEQTREAIALINGRVKTESSGGITMENIRQYAESGVDYISVGALTHQIKSLDMSLKAC
jgi:nicotinate-nucleotide pyrophosphorylase (carboxylating)